MDWISVVSNMGAALVYCGEERARPLGKLSIYQSAYTPNVNLQLAKMSFPAGWPDSALKMG